VSPQVARIRGLDPAYRPTYTVPGLEQAKSPETVCTNGTEVSGELSIGSPQLGHFQTDVPEGLGIVFVEGSGIANS
jgi:hypothetical protein